MKDVVSVISRTECKVDGLIISNTTIERKDLSNTEFVNEVGGLSGKPLTNKSTEMIKQMYKLTNGKKASICENYNINYVHSNIITYFMLQEKYQ